MSDGLLKVKEFQDRVSRIKEDYATNKPRYGLLMTPEGQSKVQELSDKYATTGKPIMESIADFKDELSCWLDSKL